MYMDRIFDNINTEAYLNLIYSSVVITSTAVVKQWDETVVDADAVTLKREDKKTPVSAWDGRKDSNISFILERHSTLKGLGPGGESLIQL